MKKKEERMTFEDLIHICTVITCDALIKDGFSGIEGAMHRVHQYMYTWNENEKEFRRNKNE